MTETELPVDWFDAPDDRVDDITNNDLDPTPQHWDDHEPFWHTEREWIYPHPDMEGYTCSTGWRHVPRQRPPAAPVGLSTIPVPRSMELGSYGGVAPPD